MVTLSGDERAELRKLVHDARSSKLSRKRSAMLLALDDSVAPGALSDAAAAKAFGVRPSTVQALRRIFVLEGLDAALHGHPRSEPPIRPKIDGELEARLVQLACSKPPAGYAGWSLRLLTDRFVELAYPGGVSCEAVRKALKKTNSSLGGRSIT